MNGEQIDCRTQLAKGLISHTWTGGRPMICILYYWLHVACLFLLMSTLWTGWVDRMLSVKVLQHWRVAMSQVCFKIDRLHCFVFSYTLETQCSVDQWKQSVSVIEALEQSFQHYFIYLRWLPVLLFQQQPKQQHNDINTVYQ